MKTRVSVLICDVSLTALQSANLLQRNIFKNYTALAYSRKGSSLSLSLCNQVSIWKKKLMDLLLCCNNLFSFAGSAYTQGGKMERKRLLWEFYRILPGRLTSLMKYLGFQVALVAARCFSSLRCLSSSWRLCSVAVSMSPALSAAVTCCHNRLSVKNNQDTVHAQCLRSF